MRCYITNKTTDKSFKEYYPDIRLYFKETLKTLGLGKNYQIALILVDSRRIQEINRDYRGIDKETDVITFALNDSEDDYEMMEEDVYLGDIFINVDRVYSQAKEYEHSVKREFCFLFVHGLLHSLGYDHVNKKDEKVMFDLQKQILKDLR